MEKLKSSFCYNKVTDKPESCTAEKLKKLTEEKFAGHVFLPAEDMG